MNARGLRHYVDDLQRGRRPKPFAPDDFEAAQIRTAIELRAAGQGSDDAPRREFLDDLHRRLAAQMSGTPPQAAPKPSATRRQVLVGTSAAAVGAVAAVSIDRAVMGGPAGAPASDIAAGQLTPNDGSWQRVAASSDVPDGIMHPFDLGSMSGFVRRVDGKPQAISGVCTHQGCRLWFDAPDDRLRCPCHTTSFSPTGQVLTHQLPIAPKPLPTLEVREVNGFIEVFAPPV